MVKINSVSGSGGFQQDMECSVLSTQYSVKETGKMPELPQGSQERRTAVRHRSLGAPASSRLCRVVRKIRDLIHRFRRFKGLFTHETPQGSQERRTSVRHRSLGAPASSRLSRVVRKIRDLIHRFRRFKGLFTHVTSQVSQERRTAVRFRSSFTLMELLIVVAMIGILVSLLLPSLSQARKKAQNGVCLSNLRQLAVASIVYDQSYQTLMTTGRGNFARWGFIRGSDKMIQIYGTFAIHYLGAPDGSEDTQNPGEYGTALRFYSSDVFHCPLNPVEAANSGDAAKNRKTNAYKGSNYGFFSGSTNDVKMNILKLQAKFEIYQDTYSRELGSSIALWGDVCNRDPNPSSNWAFDKTNHKKSYNTAPTTKEEADQLVEGGNVAHADGSAKRYRYNVPSWAAGAYSEKQTGSLNWDFVTPSTAMYPSADYPAGNFKTTHGYIVGPFSMSGP